MKRKTFYTKELGKKVAEGAKIVDPHRYHIIRSDGHKWAVVADGKTRALRVFPDQKQAKFYAEQTATKSNGKVIVHKSTGEVEEVVSFED
ncbi:DUF2188 domain-containing protein [Flavimarina sp. Hel_I_48]|uniref:DUF2188 domain-containing protein n=1 Tax=Flavimarina sp. Hel_I_48 TaxID=1392488 RepID=UPI000689D674|nr:DUF2188 domain-containing protein [Flavimarina sp. Hel_I_48]